jgi:drug/metabolite transporter (DMT)-like permease
VLVATVLALTSAGLHAGWNLAAKRSRDPFIALWGQFAVAALIAAVVLGATGTLPPAGWGWAAVSGAVHLPYVVALGVAYAHGDFSLAYPLARGGGALVAGIGGIVLLGDDVDGWSMAAIVVAATGMALLAVGAERRQVAIALFVATTIGTYTLVDSHAAREVDDVTYIFAVFLAAGVLVTIYGVAAGRTRPMLTALAGQWRRFTLTATMSLVTYGLVLLAVRRAPVGYVAALRESSVLVAAYVGGRYLDEGRVRRRALAAAVIVGGLVLLVASA